MKTFSEMGLPESLRHTLTHLNFVAPTPIQAKAIPIALKGNDILGSAQTGTGKTVASVSYTHLTLPTNREV